MPTEVTVHIVTVAVNLDDAGKPDGMPETVSVEAAGKIALLNGRPVLRYTEPPSEAGGEPTDVTVSSTDGTVTVKRRGAANVEMYFTPGKKQTTLYKIPPYAFDMEIETLKIVDKLDAEGGSLVLRYRMTIGGVPREVEMRLGTEAL